MCVCVCLYGQAGKAGSCPYRPAEKHTHSDPYSNYGAGVALSANGKLLLVGAPTAWDNNMDYQNGAVYFIDVSDVEDDGLEARTVTLAANDRAGCVNGRDANGNACVGKGYELSFCKDIVKKDGTIVHYGPPGCKPSPPPPSFWTADIGLGASPSELSSGFGLNPFRASELSAYTAQSPSIKGGVGVPVAQNTWLSNQVNAASQASYFGVPTTSLTRPRDSVVSAAGWPSSVTPALGGLPSPPGVAPAPPGLGVRSALSVLSSALGGIATPAGVAGAGPPGLPPGAVIRNPGLLTQDNGV